MSVDISFLKNASPRDKGTSLKQNKIWRKKISQLYILWKYPLKMKEK